MHLFVEVRCVIALLLRLVVPVPTWLIAQNGNMNRRMNTLDVGSFGKANLNKHLNEFFILFGFNEFKISPARGRKKSQNSSNLDSDSWDTWINGLINSGY